MCLVACCKSTSMPCNTVEIISNFAKYFDIIDSITTKLGAVIADKSL